MPNWITRPEPYDHFKTLWENKQRQRGVLRCHCGTPVQMNWAVHAPDYTTQCDGCGQLYNLVGQELIPKNLWDQERIQYDAEA
jgi:hypothetical protein